MSKDEGEGLFALLRRLEGALPDDDEIPAIRRPRLLVLRVAADVAPELRVPERAVGLRPRGSRANGGLDKLAAVPLPPMLVPEASSNLD